MQAPHYMDCVRRVGLRVCYIRLSSAPGEVGKWSSGSIGSRHDPPSRERARARSCRAMVRPVWTVRRFLNDSWTLRRRVPRASWDHDHMKLPAYLRAACRWTGSSTSSRATSRRTSACRARRAGRHNTTTGWGTTFSRGHQRRPSRSQRMLQRPGESRRSSPVHPGNARQRWYEVRRRPVEYP